MSGASGLKSRSKLIVYSDGGARGNPGPAAVGVLVCDEQGHKLGDHSEVIGETTNNVAEYTAVLRGLTLAAELKGVEVDYFLDSELVARQLSGIYKLKAEHLRPLFTDVKEKEKKFKRVTYFHVPREHEKIRYVDKLVNIALNKAGC
ncbi:MAG: 14.7 kDa ribonuclease H-like protein [Candidatus Omnitrophica bacterium ADurb.Bin292]|jgi:ribonuclease HI|nr:MAG: 14.7 kDa ribonuclease H-like protein [Candidatus Omnitrophica bacterium ADurb.Bin292]HOG24188.1 ribonuclease HI family protein [Candidatus Omnitrophota bacterium]HPW77092.1 ribonuclease HI family protein [Candidatus Omnitrophota bacterium]